MGCTGSSPKALESRSQSTTIANKNNPLSTKEILLRIEASPETSSLVIAQTAMRYAYVSQRGYYPEALEKENQDSYILLPRFGSNRNEAFFGVFDGHGKQGHLCSRFARDNLPKFMLDKIAQHGGSTSTVRQVLKEAHQLTNQAMHIAKNFDDSLSGTTAISMYLKGRTMYISNVGDSRAMVVSATADGRFVAKAMSMDQTPYRRDERDRIKKTGARVMSMDQIEGLEPMHENWGEITLGEDIDEGGDPPRVWSANGNFPGTAFTRSLGDLFAEECGVFAEPEILEREIRSEDKYIVLASDGVFEFLTNQMVADILVRYNDPLEACKQVVNTAYNMWLQYEVRTDDITILCFFIDNMRRGSVFGDPSSMNSGDQADSALSSSPPARRPSLVDAAAMAAVAKAAATSPGGGAGAHTDAPIQGELELQEQSRPVRRVMSRAKKNMIQIKDDTDTDVEISDAEIRSLKTIKTKDELLVINNAVVSNFLFQHLSVVQRRTIAEVMKSVEVKRGEFVIKQGEPGDLFYVIDSGVFEVRVIFPGTGNLEKIHFSNPESAGDVVHVYESGPENHPGFGELSLMYGKPRAASVIAATDGRLWALDRRVFKQAVLRPKDMRKNVIRVLKKVALLRCLNLTQLQRLTDLLNEQTFNPGDYIIKQGDFGDIFYIIEHGQCDCTINIPADPADATSVVTTKTVLQLKSHDYFGERALLEAKPRAANVIARMPTKVLYIGKSSFEEVLGPLAHIIDEDRRRREAAAAIVLAQGAPEKLADVKLVGTATTDTALGPVMLGCFRTEGIPNLCVRTFILNEVHKQSMVETVIRYIDAVRIVTAAAYSTATTNMCVPKHVGLFRESNAIHILFKSPIVCDYTSLIRNFQENFTYKLDTINFTAACVVTALETLHAQGIAYRAVQPDSLYVDINGRLVMIDFRVCKLGITPTSKTFTICGVADYLAPEQIAQTGHGFPVDLWGLGVTLYELATGTHPFSANSEVATYAKISSFGSEKFKSMTYPDYVSTEVRSFINSLLQAAPEERKGARRGVGSLKEHPVFNAPGATPIKWDKLMNGSYNSPLQKIVQEEKAAVMKDGMDSELLASFTEAFDREAEGGSLELLDSIQF